MLPLNAVNKKQTVTYAAALFTIVLWSSAFPASKYSLDYYSPGSIMLLRFIVASVTLGIIGIIRKIKLPKVKDLPLFALAGFVGMFLYMYCFNTGTAYVASGISSFIIASAPVFAIVLSRIILKEVVKPACWAGVGVSFCGLVIITLSQTTDFTLNVGVFLLLGAAIATSLYNILQRKLLKTYSALEATTYTIVIATLFMFIFLPTFIRELPGSTLAVNLIVSYLGVFPAALAFLSWGFALSKAEKTTHITVFLYLVPFFASFIAYLWLRETISIWAFLGGVVIIAGMVLSNMGAAKAK
ncbi:MAG: DMT family transporter [Oscillospiraceae bacterium]|nr:DMT family transporter [Oscillospiraceae bacterium]